MQSQDPHRSRNHIAMRTFKLLLLILLLYISAGRLQAQELDKNGQSSAPIAPLGPLDTRAENANSGAVDTQIQNSAQLQPDHHTLSGAETLGLGSLRSLGHIFDPSAFVTESADTGSSNNKLDSFTSVGGNLDFSHSSSQQALSLMYNGGASFVRGYATYNQQFHNLGLSEDISRGAWTFQFGDFLMFSSQGANFGGFNTGGFTLGAQGALLNGSQFGLVPGLQPGLLPLQTINTGIADRLGNSTYAETDYALTRRARVTFEGSYGLLHFLSAGYVNSSQIQGRLGYNLALGPKNMIAVSYDYTKSKFGATSQSVDIQSLQISYGRTIAGRLALQLGGGPALRDFRNYVFLSGNRLSWNLYSGLTYNTGRTGYSLMYSHGTTLGSGVFFGAETDMIMANVSRPLTRFWTASLYGGYARNSSLTSNLALGGVLASNLAVNNSFSNLFENWYANVDVGRQLGRQFRFDLNYGFQQQTFGGQCPVLSCGIGVTPQRHTFSINFYWHPLTAASERRGRSAIQTPLGQNGRF
jgi:hypothetical protein